MPINYFSKELIKSNFIIISIFDNPFLCIKSIKSTIDCKKNLLVASYLNNCKCSKFKYMNNPFRQV